MVLPGNNNIITRSSSIDSNYSDVSVNQNAPIKQIGNENRQLGVNFQRDRGASIGSNEHSRLAGKFNEQIDALIGGLNMKTSSGRGKQLTNLLFYNRRQFSSTSLKAMTKTMERLATGDSLAKSDLKTLRKDLLKVSAGKTGLRAFGMKGGPRAMALRQEVRNTALLTFLKTGDMQLAKQVKQDMIDAMTLQPPGGKGKSEFQQVINAKSHEAIKQLDLRFNDIAGFVEKATPGELRSALGKGSLIDQNLSVNPQRSDLNQAGPQGTQPQILVQQEPGNFVNVQVKNDELIAKELHENHNDLDNLTKGNIKKDDFITKGDDSIVDTSSDEAISREFFRNQKDLNDLTKGNIKREDFITKGNDEGQVDYSVEDTSSDEVISQEFFRNQKDLNDLTKGNIKKEDFITKGNDEGQVDYSVEDTSSDEVISQEFFRNQQDLNDLTKGDIKRDEFITGNDGE